MNTRIKKMIFKRMMFVAVLLLSLVFAPSSYAALNAVGPANPVDGFPTWYQDANGLTIGQCLDLSGNCIVLADDFYDGINPIVFPGNYPGESFYWIADTGFGPFRYRAALEAAFATVNPAGAPVDGQQSVFARIRVRGQVPAVGTYTFTHPYGTETFVVTALTPGTPEINFTNDVPAGIPLDFAGALAGQIGPFLLASATPGGAPLPFVVDPVTGARYIANAALFVSVTGSPVGTNEVRIVGPASNDSTPLFNLAGKIIGMTASPAAVIFPAQKAGIVTAASITITNPLTTPATLGAGAFSGANAADFAIAASTCATPIAAAGTCAVTVNFTEAAPGVFGAKSAVVSFPVTTPLNLPPLVVNLAASIDNQLPTITTTTPLNNAVNVPANNAITATFSEPVTGVSSTTFTLTSGGAPVTGAVTYNAASNTAVFTPAANLTVNGNFTATIVGGAAGITDIAGNALAANSVISFTTTLPDTTPPAVVSNTPANNTLVVPTNSVITVKFNEPVDPATVNETTITVKTPAGAVAGTVTYDPLTLTARFSPAQSLAGNQLHTVTITTGIKSLGGVPMTAAFTSTFVTNAAPTKPVLVAPASNQTGVGTTVDFQWIKSSDSDNDAVTYKLFYCTNQFMVNCNPVTVAQSASVHNTLAGFGGYGAGLLLAGVFFAGGVKSRRRLFLFFAVLLISGMVATACSKSSTDEPAGPLGPGGSVIDPATLVTKNVTGLTPATTYYWKVVADDGHGGLAESDITSFKTQ